MTKNFGLDPTDERRKRAQGLMKETLSAVTAPLVARYRARAPFTLLAMREQILEEAKEKPKPKRERSIRRRLTPFDRALSEEEATIIDILVRAHLVICAKARGSGWEQSVDASSVARLPFSIREHDILAVSGNIKNQLKPEYRAILADLCHRMTPDCEPLEQINFEWIAIAKRMAEAAFEIYSKTYGN